MAHQTHQHPAAVSIKTSSNSPIHMTTLGTTMSSKSQQDNELPHGLAYSNDMVEERRYGCDRLGTVAAVIIIVILIAGTVPFVFVVSNRQIALLATCLTLVVVLILVFLYTSCQKRTVRKQRELFNRGESWGSNSRAPTNDRQHHNVVWRYTSVPTSANESSSNTMPTYYDKHNYSSRVTTPTSWAFRMAPTNRSDGPTNTTTNQTHSIVLPAYNNHISNNMIDRPNPAPSSPSRQYKPSRHTLIH